MDLTFKRFGSGPAVIILHGLYGSSDNWISIAKKFIPDYDVILPDLRNHGSSPHSPYHNYNLMQKDIYDLMVRLNLKTATIIGHSMGGKTAMFFAKNHSEMISNLIVLDISPFSYHSETGHGNQIELHIKITSALSAMNIEKLSSRKEADQMLSDLIEQPHLRNFLLKNLKRSVENKYKWKLNLKAIKESLPYLLEGFDRDNNDHFISGFPVLFIKGGLSGYIKETDIDDIRKIFPAAEFETINMAGHWLHAEQPEKLIEIIKKFIV